MIFFKIRDEKFERAEKGFKQAFQFYHEIGSVKTSEMLKFNTLTAILTNMTIDPFGTPETNV